MPSELSFMDIYRVTKPCACSHQIRWMLSTLKLNFILVSLVKRKATLVYMGYHHAQKPNTRKGVVRYID